jgi:hypothetical protein
MAADEYAGAVPERFPISEGVGLFVGIVAWDVLSAGEMNCSSPR